MNFDIPAIASHFRFAGRLLDAVSWGGGHINDTYALRFEQRDGSTLRYILQRINHEVFHDPPRLMQNVVRITEHLRRKISEAGGDPDREALHLIPTTDAADGTLYRADDGTYWRAYDFVEGTRTYDVAETPAQVYSAGRAFGKFQRLVSDFPPGELYETIPNFHHTPARYQIFADALRRDACHRAAEVQEEIAFLKQRAAEMSVLVDLLAAGKLPQRVTHNDTKLNNVLIDDRTGADLCVVDLDTVMPGLALYDFGDAVRSAANPAAEDERDLGKVVFSLPIYEALARGYLEEACGFLTLPELQYLPFSARLITLECGMRFLTDYLSGDVYFRIHRPEHNLDRCRTQFKLVRDMEALDTEMRGIVEQFSQRKPD